MGKVIACVNEKGGVAKTTTVKNLSIGLANTGKKVLVIDLDPSTSLSTSLGVFPEADDKSILNILKRSVNLENIEEDFAVVHHEEGIDLIPSVTELHGYSKEIADSMMPVTVLRWYVDSVKDKYDYVFIDCPAGLEIYTKNALFAADAVIIPNQPQFLAVSAMQNIFGLISSVRKLNGTGTKPEIFGIIFTMVRPTTNNDKNVMEYYKQEYTGKVPLFNTYIPHSVRFTESDGEGKSIYKYAPKTSAAMVYADLVKEFLEMEEEKHE
jgi:chromosome partitioning protein